MAEIIGLPTRVTERAFVLQIMNLKIPQYSHNFSIEYVLAFLEEQSRRVTYSITSLAVLPKTM